MSMCGLCGVVVGDLSLDIYHDYVIRNCLEIRNIPQIHMVLGFVLTKSFQMSINLDVLIRKMDTTY